MWSSLWLTEWVNRWGHGCIIFSLYFETLALLSSLAPLPSPLHSPPPTLLPFALQLSYSKTAIYILPGKSVKSRQPASQPDRHTTAVDLLTPPLQLYRIRHEKHSKPQAPSSLAQFIVSPSLLLVGTCCNLPQLPPLTTPNKVTGRSTALRNKQTLQPRTDTHIKLGQRGF